jgi:hypothetical protein
MHVFAEDTGSKKAKLMHHHVSLHRRYGQLDIVMHHEHLVRAHVFNEYAHDKINAHDSSANLTGGATGQVCVPNSTSLSAYVAKLQVP